MRSSVPKFTLLLMGLALGGGVYSQQVQDLFPSIRVTVDKSPEGEIEFIRLRENCEDLWRRRDRLAPEDTALLRACDQGEGADFDDYYDVLPMGCSWYCGGGLDTLSASSELKPSNGLRYTAGNVHDLSYETAWIEGVPGYGAGESVTYHLPPENPRITKIIVVNGYAKSGKAWRENSRVKRLRMYLDERPYATLNLEDSRAEQSFVVDPLGHGDRDNYDELRRKPWWTIRFEILEVYKGEEYDDTAITEIYFDGIDVH